MQIDNMLAESIELLVLGMGTVFFILLLLIACLTLMSSLMSAPDEGTDSAEFVESIAVKSNATVSNAGVVAAIQAAIHFYRTLPKR